MWITDCLYCKDCGCEEDNVSMSKGTLGVSWVIVEI